MVLDFLVLGSYSPIQLSIGSTKSAHACECIQLKQTAQALVESKAVFSGRATNIEVRPELFSKIAKFDVDKTWKGISNTAVTVVTGADSGACGFPFEVGKEYLVYSYDSHGGGSS